MSFDGFGLGPRPCELTSKSKSLPCAFVIVILFMSRTIGGQSLTFSSLLISIITWPKLVPFVMFGCIISLQINIKRIKCIREIVEKPIKTKHKLKICTSNYLQYVNDAGAKFITFHSIINIPMDFNHQRNCMASHRIASHRYLSAIGTIYKYYSCTIM